MFYKTFKNTTASCGSLIDRLYEQQPLTDLVETRYNTFYATNLPPSWSSNRVALNTALTPLLQRVNTIDITYTEYNIPKSKGGYRTISAPSDELKQLQTDVYKVLQKFKTYAHDDVFSYVPERTCLSALTRHQEKRTKWFYKFDLKSFFPSCTVELLNCELSKVYPFFLLTEGNFNNLIKLATYHGALPQGSPLSPILSNLLLTEFDYQMHYSVKHFNGVYTRYADDILISFPIRKDLPFVEWLIKQHLPQGLKLNLEKSRCGSNAGHNYNLGLCLNKDYQITLGHEKKSRLKAKINNFIFDFTNRRYWSIIETQVLQGEVNYFKQVEPEYAEFVIRRLEQKHHVASLSTMFKDIIAGRV